MLLLYRSYIVCVDYNFHNVLHSTKGCQLTAHEALLFTGSVWVFTYNIVNYVTKYSASGKHVINSYWFNAWIWICQCSSLLPAVDEHCPCSDEPEQSLLSLFHKMCCTAYGTAYNGPQHNLYIQVRECQSGRCRMHPFDEIIHC